jgi:glutaredoxin 3
VSMAKSIKVYSTPACPRCEAVKKFFRENGMAYQDFNVALDFNALQEGMEKSGQLEFPVINIDGEILVGFEPSRLRKKLGLSA